MLIIFRRVCAVLRGSYAGALERLRLSFRRRARSGMRTHLSGCALIDASMWHVCVYACERVCVSVCSAERVHANGCAPRRAERNHYCSQTAAPPRPESCFVLPALTSTTPCIPPQELKRNGLDPFLKGHGDSRYLSNSISGFSLPEWMGQNSSGNPKSD